MRVCRMSHDTSHDTSRDLTCQLEQPKGRRRVSVLLPLVLHQWITREPCLPACLPARFFAYLFACLPACLFVCLPACLYTCLPVSLPVCLPACLIVCLPACLFTCLPACLPTKPGNFSCIGLDMHCYSTNCLYIRTYLSSLCRLHSTTPPYCVPNTTNLHYVQGHTTIYQDPTTLCVYHNPYI